MTAKDDIRWMSRAVQLAKKGRYTTRPNPNVGCVLVKGGELLAEGWHYRTGEAHAEVHALSQVGDKAKGATAYVTLEPCNHQGRTGPCSQALIDAGVARVVYGMADPNPLVAGQGLQRLKDAGITVDGPVLESACADLNPGFIKRMKTGLPWVRCKLASSLDGRSAMASGESQWITGAAARGDVQKLRAKSGAIVTGIGSILADNSRLTLRIDQLDLPNTADAVQCAPLRVVLDGQLQIPSDAEILNADAKTLVVTSAESLAQDERVEHWQNTCPHIEVRSVAADNGLMSLDAVLRLLAEEFQINDVLVEAGATLSGAFLQQDLIDELVIYQAPVLMGSEARPLFQLPLSSMADKVQLVLTDCRQIGDDWRLTARVKRSADINN